MQRFFILTLSFISFLTPVIGWAQSENDSTDIEETFSRKVEEISEQTESELDISDYVASLEYFRQNPVNLNNTDYETLARLGLLNEIQIRNLLAHIEKNGKLLNLYELQSIEAFTPDVIQALLPYVVLKVSENKKTFNFRDVFRYGNHEVMYRYQRVLEKQKGYEKVSDSVRQLSPGSYYTGSKDKMYLKYRFNYFNNVKIGLTAEKDAGEPFFRGSNPYGFDFYSGYININNLGVLKNLVIGDYSLQFGQGLTLWTGFAMGKSADAVAIKKLPRGVLPYNSVTENGFMRGLAFTLAFKKISFTGFYSIKNIDANMVSDTNQTEESYLSSIVEDGLHNTILSEAKEKKALENIFGGNLQFKNKALSIGATAYATFLNTAVNRNLVTYNQFEFSGKENINIGINYSYILKNINFFGETAISKSGGLATFNGVMCHIGKYISASLAYRYYQRNYQNFYTSSFGQTTNPFNETGIYTGIYIRPHYKVQLSGYVDVYKFPWLKYQVDNTSFGYDYKAGLVYKPTKKIVIDLRYKFETSLKNTDEEDIYLDYLVNVSRQSYRLNLSYPVSNTIAFSNRVEVSNYNKQGSKNEWGYYLYHDIRYRNPKSPFAFTFRFSLFDTPSYDSRIYTYENDVLYAYSLPALYDKGIRYYCILKYRVGRHIDLWLRFAQTSFSNKKTVSSGLNEINGNTQSEIKAQIRIHF